MTSKRVVITEKDRVSCVRLAFALCRLDQVGMGEQNWGFDENTARARKKANKAPGA